ncbi:MAG: Putative cytochrome P450 hydroxylase [uncultured Thermomicrobiales bacterium]|uniref:Cytochrome P450 hydroxylase n=1 Tax=uncultured Thermomicrobiales bacterium TaxID=1645740 RepID=A0A6J4TX42_9BACT|nr:MAG: Putative cytochrome P450 hydroxylase [uncultured Thermomicrobiales bacterium]
MSESHPFSPPSFFRDPYPTYHRMRAERPVYWDEELGEWVLTRYLDVAAALRDARFSSDRTTAFMAGVPEELREAMIPFARMRANLMPLTDAPRHTRLRAPIEKAFAKGIVDARRAHAQGLVERAIDAAVQRGRLDLMNDLAFPLAAETIDALLGVPPADHDRIQGWAIDFERALAGGVPTVEALRAADAALFGLAGYLRGLVAERQAAPQNDLIGALVAAEGDGDALAGDELVGTCLVLLFANEGTTPTLLTLGMLALLRHPEQARRLRDDPTLIRAATDEMMRYDGPTQMLWRVTAGAVTFDGVTIPAGQRVNLVLGAANRDPARFPAPDRFDPARADKRHLGFGFGIHGCVGSALARMEAEIAIEALLRRLPGLRVAIPDDELDWHRTMGLRQLNALPLVWQ